LWIVKRNCIRSKATSFKWQNIFHHSEEEKHKNNRTKTNITLFEEDGLGSIIFCCYLEGKMECPEWRGFWKH
jgi:hypothetical protein